MKLRTWILIHVLGCAGGWLVGEAFARTERYGWFLDEAPVLGCATGLLLSVLMCVMLVVITHAPRRTKFALLGVDALIAGFAALSLIVLRTPSSTCLSDPLKDTYVSTPELPAKMRKIHAGMTRKEVVEILGEPVYAPDPNQWRYSWGGRCLGESGGRSDCDCAWVLFAVEFVGDEVRRPITIWDRS